MMVISIVGGQEIISIADVLEVMTTEVVHVAIVIGEENQVLIEDVVIAMVEKTTIIIIEVDREVNLKSELSLMLTRAKRANQVKKITLNVGNAVNEDTTHEIVTQNETDLRNGLNKPSKLLVY